MRIFDAFIAHTIATHVKFFISAIETIVEDRWKLNLQSSISIITEFPLYVSFCLSMTRYNKTTQLRNKMGRFLCRFIHYFLHFLACIEALRILPPTVLHAKHH